MGGDQHQAAPFFLTILIQRRKQPGSVVTGSRLPVGRQRSRAAGHWPAPGPIATRLRSPPEHLPGWWCPLLSASPITFKQRGRLSRAPPFFFTPANH